MPSALPRRVDTKRDCGRRLRILVQLVHVHPQRRRGRLGLLPVSDPGLQQPGPAVRRPAVLRHQRGSRQLLQVNPVPCQCLSAHDCRHIFSQRRRLPQDGIYFFTPCYLRRTALIFSIFLHLCGGSFEAAECVLDGCYALQFLVTLLLNQLKQRKNPSEFPQSYVTCHFSLQAAA